MTGMESYTYLGNNQRPGARAYFINDGMVRLCTDTKGDFREAPFVRDVLLPHEMQPGTPASIDESGSTSSTSHNGLSLSLDTAENILTILHDGTDIIQQHIHEKNPLLFDITAGPGEGFYGFGEWFNAFRRTDGSLSLYNHEAPAFTQHKRTYSAFPCFLSDRGYMILILNAHRGMTRINKPRGRLTVRFSGGSLDYVFIYGPSFRTILERYTSLTGRPPLVPLWAFGLWNTAYPVENQGETLARIEQHRVKNIPLDAVIFDYHWEQGFHTFTWRKKLFPDHKAMLARMKDLGVRAGLIYTPYINKKALSLYKLLVRLYVKNAPRGVPFLSSDDAEDIYREADKKGYFAHKKVTWWLGQGGAPDFTDPEAVNWWFDRQKPLLDDGVYFFKNDGGEYLPETAVSSTGLVKSEFHNMYSFYYTRAVFEKSQEYHRGDRALVFSRTNWAGTQRFPGIFLGDQTPEFKHIAATMRCGLNMSLLGYAYWGADVLGLYRKPSALLHKRYTQWAIFSPLARYFSSPFDEDRNPWGIDASCEENFRRHADLRYRLLPYYYRLAHEASITGIPIIRPLCLEFQEDRETLAIADQAMIGDSLMLCPLISEKSNTRDIYFPSGQWYDIWDGTCYSGPSRVSISIPGDRAPLFVLGGKPVIMGPTMPFIADDHRFSDIEVRIYPPFNGASFLYEDDGRTREYEKGRYAIQHVVFRENEHEIRILIPPVEGSFDNQPVHRSITFTMHMMVEPMQISSAGDSMPHVYDRNTGILSMSLNSAVKDETEIIIMLKNK